MLLSINVLDSSQQGSKKLIVDMDNMHALVNELTYTHWANTTCILLLLCISQVR